MLPAGSILRLQLVNGDRVAPLFSAATVIRRRRVRIAGPRRLEQHGSVPAARRQSWVAHRLTCVAWSTPKRDDVTKPESRTDPQAR